MGDEKARKDTAKALRARNAILPPPGRRALATAARAGARVPIRRIHGTSGSHRADPSRSARGRSERAVLPPPIRHDLRTTRPGATTPTMTIDDATEATRGAGGRRDSPAAAIRGHLACAAGRRRRRLVAGDGLCVAATRQRRPRREPRRAAATVAGVPRRRGDRNRQRDWRPRRRRDRHGMRRPEAHRASRASSAASSSTSIITPATALRRAELVRLVGGRMRRDGVRSRARAGCAAHL